MATYTICSEPAPSRIHTGRLYAYYDQPTETGSKATLLLHPSLEGLVHRGDTIDDGFVIYDDTLRHAVLMPSGTYPVASNDAGPTGSADLHEEPPTRWQTDEDRPAATARAPVHQNWVTTPAGLQRQVIQQEVEAGKIPTDILQQAELMARLYLYIAKRIGVREAPRASEAKSMAITLMINNMRNADIPPALHDSLAQSLR